MQYVLGIANYESGIDFPKNCSRLLPRFPYRTNHLNDQILYQILDKLSFLCLSSCLLKKQIKSNNRNELKNRFENFIHYGFYRKSRLDNHLKQPCVGNTIKIADWWQNHPIILYIIKHFLLRVLQRPLIPLTNN